MSGKCFTSRLDGGGNLISSATSLTGEYLATGCQAEGASFIQIWEGSGTGEWQLKSQTQVQAPVLHLCWAHPESGLLVAGASDTGDVYLIEAPRPSVQTDTSAAPHHMGSQPWTLAASLQASTSGVSHLSFAPRQYGLLLCAACHDGHVLMWEGDRPLAPNSWLLQAKFKVGRRVKASAGGGALASAAASLCTGLAWRGFTAGLAALLAVSTPDSVEVWQYVSALMTWQHVTSLSPSSSQQPLTSVHWAPTMGRPVDLIAASHGNQVDIWSMRGDSSAPQVELVTTLKHDSPVWKVEFNLLGTCLAAATEANEVIVWRPDLVGAWHRMVVVQGSEDVDAGRDGSEGPQDMAIAGGDVD